jgi:predicted ATPase
MGDIGKLTHIKVEGFKSIRRLDLDLRDLNVLIGPNGAGKSNLIGFFRFMNKLVEKDLQLFVKQQGGAEKILHFGEKVTDRLVVELRFPPNSYGCTLVPTTSGGLVFEYERYEFPPDDAQFLAGIAGGVNVHRLASPGAEESALPSWAERHPEQKIYAASFFHSWKVYHFHDTSDSAKVKKPGKVNDVGMLRPDASNLAAFLRFIRERHAENYAEIVASVRRVAPFFHDFVLEPDPASPEYISLRWKHVGTDAYFDGTDLSDGTLRFICLATLLLQPDLPTTILLDEPELGLHPYAVQLLAGLMRSAATRTQIIASTQSVTLANQFDWQDLVVADRQDNASIYRRLEEGDVKDWLDHYGVGDIWQKNLIGGTP